jgi:putative effector of murein hydrolase LrgA (UPF0299 family)
MKNLLKTISTVAILLFGAWWIGGMISNQSIFDITEISTGLVLLYIICSWKYYQLECKDKEDTILQLKAMLGQEE